MRRLTNLPALELLLLVFISGLCFGLFLCGHTHRSGPAEGAAIPARAASGDEMANENPVDAEHSRHIDELAQKIADLNDSVPADALAARIAFFRKLGSELQFSANLGTEVAPAMADILEMSPQEKEAVNRQLVEAEREMEQLEGANMATKQTPDHVTLEVPALPDGSAIKSQLAQAVTSELGQVRGSFFMDNGVFTGDTSFHGFGQEKQQISISPKNGPDGTPQYEVQNTFGNWSYTQTFNIIPDYLSNYIDVDAQQPSPSENSPPSQTQDQLSESIRN